MSAATREGLVHRAGWLVALWLSAEPTKAAGSQGRLVPSPVGPMRGTIRLTGSEDSFEFLRYGRAPVTLAYSQIVTWQEIAPPPRPPLPVEERSRP